MYVCMYERVCCVCYLRTMPPRVFCSMVERADTTLAAEISVITPLREVDGGWW